MKRSAILLSAFLLGGCVPFTAWVAAHQSQLLAVGLVAGTASQVGSALVQADEVAERVERRIKGDE